MKTLREARQEFLTLYVREALHEAHGNTVQAAKIAGIHRSQFTRLRHSCGLAVRAYRYAGALREARSP